jgi:hypothetical protein
MELCKIIPPLQLNLGQIVVLLRGCRRINLSPFVDAGLGMYGNSEVDPNTRHIGWPPYSMLRTYNE